MNEQFSSHSGLTSDENKQHILNSACGNISNQVNTQIPTRTCFLRSYCSTLPSKPLFKSTHFLQVSDQNFVRISLPTKRATCPTHLNFIYLKQFNKYGSVTYVPVTWGVAVIFTCYTMVCFLILLYSWKKIRINLSHLWDVAMWLFCFVLHDLWSSLSSAWSFKLLHT